MILFAEPKETNKDGFKKIVTWGKEDDEAYSLAGDILVDDVKADIIFRKKQSCKVSRRIIVPLASVSSLVIRYDEEDKYSI